MHAKLPVLIKRLIHDIEIWVIKIFSYHNFGMRL